MRFASILFLLLSFVPMTIADGGKNPSKNSGILPPAKQMELAMDDYKKLATEFYQFHRKSAGLPHVPGKHREIHLAMQNKGKEILNLSQSLEPNDELYKKAKARRIELANKSNKLIKKRWELEDTNPGGLAQFEAANKTEDLGIELSVVTLVEQANAPRP